VAGATLKLKHQIIIEGKGMDIFETVSFHIVKPCNMKCKFCYATFDDMHVGPQMTLPDAKEIIRKLIKAGVQKITFAGGEPLLYKDIKEVIIYAKDKGATTSIITNGSLLYKAWLSNMAPHLDWIGISVDSLSDITQERIGRITKGTVQYYELISDIKQFGYKLKINTVINSFNWSESMNYFIDWAKPDRWKVFQALRVKGQNDKQWDEVKVEDWQYQSFIDNHSKQKALVIEDNRLMTGSYLLIDPLGRLFENSAGKHTYSDSLINNNIDHCLSQINLNRETFIARGGVYEW
jgi:radical S-adenosyl methionine domain-containing protein 2